MSPADDGRESDPARADVVATEPEPARVRDLFGPNVAAARRYVQSLATAGIVRGLIGPREAARLWTRHVLNSAAAASLLTSGQRIVDIGSGAGLPGIPLALARADCRFDLVEPLLRRSDYLREVVSELGLTNVRVFRGRADEVVASCGGSDAVTSRAVAALAKLAGWSAPLLRTGGEMLALKGSTAADELARDGRALRLAGFGPGTVEPVGSAADDAGTFVIRARLR